MSLRIGIIINININEKVLDKIRKKYNIGLIKFNNKYVQRQIEDDESFFQYSKCGDDTEYGIGAYDIYIKNLETISNEKLSEEREEDFIETKRRKNMRIKKYEETAEEIINIIKEILAIKKIKRIGIFYFDGYTTSDEVKVHKLDKQICSIKDIDVETIMKIEENVLVYFQ